MPSLLIIGGSGFFGKSILSAYKRGLLARWSIDSIKVISRNATHLSIRHPELRDASITLYDQDASSCAALPSADYVIHAAASVNVSGYVDAPQQREKDIQAVVSNYYKLAPIHHRNCKIVYASSGAVYGASHDPMARAQESQLLGSLSTMNALKRHYAIGKLSSEALILQLAQEGLNVSIARCFAFIGEYLPRDGTFALGSFIQDGLDGRSIIVNAQNKIYRSYMHADDLVQWLMTIAEDSSPNCPIYNVGSDEAIEIRSLAQKIGQYFDLPVQFASEEALPADVYVPSIERAKSKLNLYINVPFDQAVDQTVTSIKRTGSLIFSRTAT